MSKQFAFMCVIALLWTTAPGDATCVYISLLAGVFNEIVRHFLQDPVYWSDIFITQANSEGISTT